MGTYSVGVPNRVEREISIITNPKPSAMPKIEIPATREVTGTPRIESIVNRAINHAIRLLSTKISLMDILVDELLEKETLDGVYIINTLNSFQSYN